MEREPCLHQSNGENIDVSDQLVYVLCILMPAVAPQSCHIHAKKGYGIRREIHIERREKGKIKKKKCEDLRKRKIYKYKDKFRNAKRDLWMQQLSIEDHAYTPVDDISQTSKYSRVQHQPCGHVAHVGHAQKKSQDLKIKCS